MRYFDALPTNLARAYYKQKMYMGSKRQKQISPKFVPSESEEARLCLAGGIRRSEGSGPPRVSDDSEPQGTTDALLN